jgi:hypothetical protein
MRLLSGGLRAMALRASAFRRAGRFSPIIFIAVAASDLRMILAGAWRVHQNGNAFFRMVHVFVSPAHLADFSSLPNLSGLMLRVLLST